MSEQQYRVVVQDWMKNWGYTALTTSAAQADIIDRLVRIERPVPTTDKCPECGGAQTPTRMHKLTCSIGQAEIDSLLPSPHPPTREQIAALRLAHTSGQQLRAIHHNAALDAVLDLIPQVTREQVESAVGAVLFNASNYPRSAMPHMLGQDIEPLRAKVTDAVLALLQKGADR